MAKFSFTERYGMRGVLVFNSQFGVTYNMSDDDLLNYLSDGLCQRMAVNNCTYIFEKYPKSVTDKLPYGLYGENYLDCSNDITTLPRFWDYMRGGKVLIAICYACRYYGYNFDECFGAETIRDLPNITAEQIARCEASADVLADELVERCKTLWYSRVNSCVDDYGDLFFELTGHDSLSGNGTSDAEIERHAEKVRNGRLPS